MPLMLTEATSIDYDVHGEGPPLILINGLGFGRWAWFKQVPTLSRHFRTITFDVRGERYLKDGVADLTADVVALLEHLGVRKTHVLGTSLGGFVAQELTLERPDLVDRLVLICTSYGYAGPENMSPWALKDMIGWPSLSIEGAVRRGLETATSDAYRDQYPEEFEQIVRWRLTDSPSLSAYYEQMRAGTRFDVSHSVGSITSPTLVVHGAEDRYVPQPMPPLWPRPFRRPNCVSSTMPGTSSSSSDSLTSTGRSLPSSILTSRKRGGGHEGRHKNIWWNVVIALKLRLSGDGLPLFTELPRAKVFSEGPLTHEGISLFDFKRPSKTRIRPPLHQRKLHLGGLLLIQQGVEAERRDLVSREPTC